jgi:HEPN domain-containing protein
MSAPEADAEWLREVRRWLHYAEEDLRGARAATREPDLASRHACFFAQQAAEKALKAGLVFLDIEVPRRHDLDALRNLLPEDWTVRQKPLALAKLTQWAVEARYPGDLPDANENDALEAVVIAELVLEYVTGDLEETGFTLEQ